MEVSLRTHGYEAPTDIRAVISSVRLVAAAVLCMLAISGLQYTWTLFVGPIHNGRGWSNAEIQTAFSHFIEVQAFGLLLYGYIVDRYGARGTMMCAGVLVAASWIINSYASSLEMLYNGQRLGGFGTGLVIAAAYGSIMKEFTGRRGLAIGIVSAGYALGAAFSAGTIESLIRTAGYEEAFFWAGLTQGGVIVITALVLMNPQAQSASSLSIRAQLVDVRVAALQLLKTVFTLRFVVMYAMFALVAAGGLMFTAQLAPIAKAYGVADQKLVLFGVTASAVVWAIQLDRLTNAASRPFFGFLSDIIGREYTLALVFTLEAGAVFLLETYAHDPVAFVLLTGLVFFGWGEIFSLFPSLCTDLFGTERATTNYGALYSAKGVGAWFVPYASVLAAGGHWDRVFYVVVAFDLSAAMLALVLRTLRR